MPVRSWILPWTRQYSGVVPAAATSVACVMRVPAIVPEGWTGKPVRVTSDAHVAAGESAFITVSCATGSLEFFDQSSNTFAPGCRPATTPLIAPAPSECTAEVTSAPFSLSVARELSALDGAATCIATDGPLTYPVSTVSGVAIE